MMQNSLHVILSITCSRHGFLFFQRLSGGKLLVWDGCVGSDNAHRDFRDGVLEGGKGGNLKRGNGGDLYMV